MNRGTATAGVMFGSAAIISVGVAYSPAPWLDAASAVGTVVLVAVTAWYVVLTRQLVVAQGETLAHARTVEETRAKAAIKALQRQAYVEIWQACHSLVISTEAIEAQLAPLRNREVPYKDIRAAVADLYSDEAQEWADATAKLASATLGLPDGDIHMLTWKSSVQLMRGSNLLALLNAAALQAELDARTAGNEPKLTDLINIWSVAYRPRSSGKVEWEDLIRGKPFEKMSQDLLTLEEMAFTAAREDLSA